MNVESVSIDIDGLERTASFLEFPGEVRCCVIMAIVLCDYCMERCFVRVSCTSTREGILLCEDRVEVICVERSDGVTVWM